MSESSRIRCQHALFRQELPRSPCHFPPSSNRAS
ncbi:MAG: hypothetical protein KJS91_10415 [Planctomycetes bacterium]|nr:hypothetical protein [Planctomycetota bacterium]